MLVVKKPAQFIKKAVQLPNGAWAMVVFELVERDGHIIAKAVSGKLLESFNGGSATMCLPCIKSSIHFTPVKSIFYNFVSTLTKDFSFMSCQNTRAPNFC